MITYLKIKNYALIENLEIGFLSGYITITGETGAGKSILMGALSLILGKRADTAVLLKKDQKCIIEGQFKIGTQYQQFFEDNDLDFDQNSILRREILPGGKSRAFINDTPVTISVLKDLGDQLVDIHSQHQSLQLSDHIYQLKVVDYVGANESLLKEYQVEYDAYQDKNKELKRQKEEIDKISGELDFYQYQYDELNKAKLDGGEVEALEEEIRQLENAEEIKISFSTASHALAGEGMALNLLNEALNIQRKNVRLHKASEDFAARIQSASIELKDIAQEMEILAEKIEDDPQKLIQAKERMDLIMSLFQKHRVKTIHDLLSIQDNLNEKIAAITFSDEHLSKLEMELGLLWEKLKSLAGQLHTVRKEKARFIEEKIAEQLVQLGIPNASFIVKVDQTDQAGRNGMDDVRFLFSANKQAPAEEISRVASGGEVSRLMLSIKSLLSDYKGLPTLIFDEIDAGVSGEIAERMGSIMKKMSGGRQVIAITHLPQVASQGEEHFLVYKEDDEHSTVTRIKKLSDEERIIEIAKLLSGEKVTEAAISNAKALLQL